MTRHRSDSDIAFRPTAATPLEWKGDCLVLGRFGGPVVFDEEWTALDASLGGALRSLVAESGFAGSVEQVASTRVTSPCAIRRLVLLGLGPEGTLDTDDVRRAGAALAWEIKRQTPRTVRTVGVLVPGHVRRDDLICAAVEGFVLAMHEGQWFVLDHRFKSASGDATRGHAVANVDFLDAARCASAVDRGRIVSDGIVLSRELVAAPPNVIGPREMADFAEAVAESSGMTIEVLDRVACERAGFGAFLAATRGSEAEPLLLHLAYRPARPARCRLAVVALGITHDPGGLAAHGRVDGMKRHKGAAGSALGAAQVIGDLRPDVEAHFVLLLGEKGGAGPRLRPGDLVTAANGTTIEVNADEAEGRLMLADGLIFAERLSVDAIVDLATLTRSCALALGDEIAGLWTSDERLGREIEAASTAAGERVWRLPLHERYRALMRPPFADARSSGPAEAESITAALFLRGFVERTPWAHLDIAGPVWCSRVDGYRNAGATGFGVGTLVNWLCAE
jgi:leucyl aminopeptidase